MMVRDGAGDADAGGRVPSAAQRRGRHARREAARGRASIEYGPQAESALDVLDLLELAWHDCYGTAPPAQVVEDVWRVGDGDLAAFASAARLAVVDWRDLQVAADLSRRRT